MISSSDACFIEPLVFLLLYVHTYIGTVTYVMQSTVTILLKYKAVSLFFGVFFLLHIPGAGRVPYRIHEIFVL